MSSNELTLSKYLVPREPKYADKELRVMQMIVTTIARRGDGKNHRKVSEKPRRSGRGGKERRRKAAVL